MPNIPSKLFSIFTDSGERKMFRESRCPSPPSSRLGCMPGSKREVWLIATLLNKAIKTEEVELVLVTEGEAYGLLKWHQRAREALKQTTNYNWWFKNKPQGLCLLSYSVFIGSPCNHHMDYGMKYGKCMNKHSTSAPAIAVIQHIIQELLWIMTKSRLRD